MESLEKIQHSISGEFEIFDTWMEKYEHIIDLGKQLEVFPEEQMIEDNKVHGCQSSLIDNHELYYLRSSVLLEKLPTAYLDQ